MFTRYQRIPFFIVPLLMILVVIGSHQSYAQSNLAGKRDSLLRLLKTQKDTARGFTLLRLADNTLRTANGRDTLAVLYAQEAYRIFNKSNNGFGMAWAKFEEGTAYMDMRQLDRALPLLTAAKEIPISDTVKRKNELLGTIWNQIAVVYDDQGNAALSTDIMMEKALPYFEAAKDERNIAFTSASLATTFLNFKQYEKAISYYKKELIDYKGPKKESYFAVDYSRLAFCLTELKRYAEARPFLDSAEMILQEYPVSYPWMKYHYANANWHHRQGIEQKALQQYNAALQVADSIHDKYNTVNILFGKYEVFYALKKYDSARTTAYGIYHINLALQDTVALDRVGIYKVLYESEKATGNNTAALQWLERYSGLADTIHKREEQVKLNDLEEKYQAQKKEGTILKLQNRSRQQQITLDRARLTAVLLIGALLIAGLLLVIFAVLARNRKKNAEQLAIMHRHQSQQQENEKQLMVYNAMLEGQEKERSRLSSDLHDGLGGMLSGINLKLQSLSDILPGASQALQPLAFQMGDAVKELRRIAHNMMPENLLRFGLTEALKDLCERLQTPQTRIVFYAAGISGDMPQQEQLAIYRIIQELLGNALKYAAATEIMVQCIQNGEECSITVEDNGAGFDAEAAAAQQGVGLLNVRNRTKYLRGSMEIHSAMATGTSIQINLMVSSYA
ncbi:tetratricopeptide repeat-containing sensor histidine kinase [Chitinophaga sp. 22321]|uniref:histidine kinase n=1 Tax=Chitinophaga hostae TaxID=2831022 RepID=A0ABS5JA92_9BACT|nr:ATP-binding protein [Chitinophaga hostae]MBS0032134.1 hypothetical protein [Chitinophaga hostae]